MNKGLLSIIIPSRTELYLQQTIDDLLEKAEEQIEIIVVLDGYWPTTPLCDDTRVVVFHHGMQHLNFGFRPSVNKGVAISSGEFIMKLDQHCVFEKGFDVKMKTECKNNYVVIPSRFTLDGPTWTVTNFDEPPEEIRFITYPFINDVNHFDCLSGKRWKEREIEKKDDKISETMTFQGSCYLMKRSFWEKLGGLDSENCGNYMAFEPEEISFKTWLSGGRVIVNKKTWYAHLHRHRAEGRRYGYSNQQERNNKADYHKARLYMRNYWLHTKDYKHDFEWLINRFWPVHLWPQDWKEQIKIDEKDKRNI